MKCLVTGGAGFIGSNLSESLLADGHRVVAVDCFTDYYARRTKLSNLAGARKHPNFQFYEKDLAKAPLAPILRDVDTVFHLAAQPGVRASWGESFSYYVRDNIVATQKLLEAMKNAKGVKKVVYSSSSSIYGDSETLPTPEDTIPRPVSPYGATKLAGEQLCHVYLRNYSVPSVILRYFTVYGPRQRPDMAFSIFISKISRGKEIEVFGDGEQRRDFTFVGDTVAATKLAATARAGSVYNVGGGRTSSINDVLSTIESIIGKKALVKRRDMALGDVRNTSADISRIRLDLGFAPSTTLREGLERQISAQIK